MAGLNFCMSTGIQRFTGTEYVNPTVGTKKLCVRTGAGANDVVKYGLTTDKNASKYCAMPIEYMEGKYAYIGRSQSYSTTRSSQYDTTSSRQSDYSTTRQSDYNTTLTRQSDYTTTRQSNYNTEDWRWSSYETMTSSVATHDSYYSTFPKVYDRSNSKSYYGNVQFVSSRTFGLSKCSIGYGSYAIRGNVNSHSGTDYAYENNASYSVEFYRYYTTYYTLSSYSYGMRCTESNYSQLYNEELWTYYLTRGKIESGTYGVNYQTTSNRQSWYTTTSSRASNYNTTRQSDYTTTSSRSSGYNTTRSSQYDITSSRESSYNTTSHNINI